MKTKDENPLAFFEYIFIENNITAELEAQLKYYDFQSHSINLPYVIKYVEYDDWNNSIKGEIEIQKILIPILRREFEKAKEHMYAAFLRNEPSFNLNYLTYQFNTIQSLITNNLSIINKYPFFLLPLKGLVKYINDRLLIPGSDNFVLDENNIEFSIDDSLNTYVKSNEQIVHLIFDYMNGKNERKEIILSEEDFNKLISYTLHLIQEESVPVIDKKLNPKLSSKDIIRFSYWVLHKELYNTSKIRTYFYDFIKEVFENFKDNDIASIKSQFGTKSRIFNHAFFPEITKKYLSRD
ncbi:hypothetical protein ACFFU9_08075 [Mariniflexile ostreae]|uniref:Uncharacterized protein n=1 Tax=Mariniflexile ostreae TaxID=1520892 RepID=A0ABV5FB62_9FLAO